MMNPPLSSKKMTMGLLMIGLGLFAVLLWLPGSGNAVLAAPPPRNTATPRPTAVPVDPPTIKSDVSDVPTGAFITLSGQIDGWTVVQWQDVNGDWHDVDGWRGSVAGGTVTWWVAQKDFGSGPFRWVVYQSDGGQLIAASGAFHLPGSANETVTITVP